MVPLFHLLICLLLSAFPLPIASGPGPVTLAANATYDYVVVGCGLAGLVVSMRISELANVSVLCIEAGPLSVALFHSRHCS